MNNTIIITLDCKIRNMQLNEKMPAFTLLGTDGKFHASSDLPSENIVVIIFTCNHCPYARAYVGRIRDLVADYSDKAVSIMAINSNDALQYPQDSYHNMITMAEQLGMESSYLYDDTQAVASAFGAKVTPEAFLFDRSRQLVYHGAIDDNWEKAGQVDKGYLEDAILALLNGDDIETAETNAVGCSVKWKKQ